METQVERPAYGSYSEIYAQEVGHLRFGMEMAAGEYWGLFIAPREMRGKPETDRPWHRAMFVRGAKNDPFLLWLIAEWWFHNEGAKKEKK